MRVLLRYGRGIRTGGPTDRVADHVGLVDVKIALASLPNCDWVGIDCVPVRRAQPARIDRHVNESVTVADTTGQHLVD